METGKDNEAFQDKEADRLIADFGHKPSTETKARVFDKLEAERDKFHRLEELKSEQKNRSKGRGR